MTNIHIRGPQRSGTNFLEALLQNNFPQYNILYSKRRSDPDNKHFRIFNKEEISKTYKEKTNKNSEPHLTSPYLHDKSIPNLNTYKQYTKIQDKDPIIFIIKSIHHWCHSYIKIGWLDETFTKQNLICEYYLYLNKLKTFKHQDVDKKIKIIKYENLLINPSEALGFMDKEIVIPKHVTHSPNFDRQDNFNSINQSFVCSQLSKTEIDLINKLDVTNLYNGF